MLDNKKIELEQQFINLLLNYKDLAGEWLEEGPQTFCFDRVHRTLLFAIEEAF